jgi:uncharacterized cysteine cluster protein YcgN (CxxCxxCC family)
MSRPRIPKHADPPTTEAAPFWESKAMSAMTREEWESLCDGCGQCCLLKIEDDDTGEIFLTRLACRLLDVDSSRCCDYGKRHKRVRDCIKFTPQSVGETPWLPESCAYRRVAEGRGLAWWHPLVSGDTETVHHAGISVRGWARSEKGVSKAAVSRYIIGTAG